MNIVMHQVKVLLDGEGVDVQDDHAVRNLIAEILSQESLTSVDVFDEGKGEATFSFTTIQQLYDLIKIGGLLAGEDFRTTGADKTHITLLLTKFEKAVITVLYQKYCELAVNGMQTAESWLDQLMFLNSYEKFTFTPEEKVLIYRILCMGEASVYHVKGMRE
jgi:hypothetical protein